MNTITNVAEADAAAAKAYELDCQGEHDQALELEKSILRFDPAYDHGRFVASRAIGYDESGDAERADRAYRVALMIDPDYYEYVANYGAFLADANKLRAAYTLLKWVSDMGTGPVFDDAAKIMRTIESTLGSSILESWRSEPLSVETITRATQEDLKRFLEDL